MKSMENQRVVPVYIVYAVVRMIDIDDHYQFLWERGSLLLQMWTLYQYRMDYVYQYRMDYVLKVAIISII